jgi:16S rRNA (guanine1516-N2)-methyltransferase
MTAPQVNVSYQTLELKERAKELAQQLELPFSDQQQASTYTLLLTANHLELRANNENFQPLYIDFLQGKNAYRQRQGYKDELLVKAIGVKSNYKPTIVDLTAGLGRDGFILASLDCEVMMLERSKIIYALLQDGLARLKATTNLSATLLLQDAKLFLSALTSENYPDVIYLDPMFPVRQKSALVKKEMRILRDLLGDDLDADQLFQLALQKAKQRVVVKRHRLAPLISDQKPSLSYVGKSTRFDVYVLGRG